MHFTKKGGCGQRTAFRFQISAIRVEITGRQPMDGKWLATKPKINNKHITLPMGKGSKSNLGIIAVHKA